MSEELEEIRRQLKLPIGYCGRSYDDAVRDFDQLLKKVESRLSMSENQKSTVDDILTHKGLIGQMELLRNELAENGMIIPACLIDEAVEKMNEAKVLMDSVITDRLDQQRKIMRDRRRQNRLPKKAEGEQ